MSPVKDEFRASPVAPPSFELVDGRADELRGLGGGKNYDRFHGVHLIC